ncbi:unnamed protein product [Euphydryas editha]|uniref:Peptidase S1 domain-containing protein n=1 Tax=Euphydryas editha TaxID=104508 RepID=A0AAU9TI58_EUPED|nr:unnamed protein product [Euphydryas editha]
MLMLNVFTLCYFTYMVSAHDAISNLLSFYTSFRRLCLCRCGISNSYENNLSYGRSLDDEIENSYEMPWLATIHTGSTTIRGTVISDRHVITAANPLHRKPASDIIVTLGSHLCKERHHALNTSVEAVLIHPGYSTTVRNNDVALLRLRNPIKFSQFISPICMPLYEPGEIDQLTWTASSPKNKSSSCLTRLATLPVLPIRICHKNAFVDSSMVTLSDKSCLGPLGIKNILCENDVGGPVMTRWLPGSPFRIAGIITNASCEDEMYPLFIRTVDNMQWIHGHIRNDCQCF